MNDRPQKFREIVRQLAQGGNTALRHANDPRRRVNPYGWNIDYLLLRRLAEWVADQSDLEAGRILDIGSGNSPYRSFFRADEYIALDVERGLETKVIGDAHLLPIRTRSIDLVVSFQVLEHLEFPEKAAAEIERVLKPGGRLVLTTHGTWPYHGHDFHRWTDEGLKLLLRNFVDISVQPLGGPLAVSTYLLGFTAREAARASVLGSLRVPARVAAAGFAWGLNLSTLALESLCAQTSTYRALSRALTDVYVVKARRTDNLPELLAKQGK
ncbi:MAG: hypothetical protein QOJ59_1037 [Thermomicrobiales bacterium]|jgi:SAM-dependent methyltransferase|nr:hypothetical protein [Thermomicrobiales bacterium]